MNQFEDNFNDGAYKWDAFNKHASVPPRPEVIEPRFQPWEFKAGTTGSLQIGKYHVDVFISDRKNSTVEPTPDNVNIYILGICEREENEYDGHEVYKQVKEEVLKEIESRIFKNVEILDNLTEY